MLAVLTTPVRIGVVFSFLISAPWLAAQAPVDDLTRPATSTARAPAAAPDPTLVLYNEVQQLRQELLRLTGTIEELNYEVQRLQAAQANDYANLDARILDLSQGLQGAGGSQGPDSVPGGADQNTTNGQSFAAQQPAIEDEAAAELYAGSLDHLRSGDRQAAIDGFSQLITDWPNDALVADSYYWIGQTHWVAADYEMAREAFAGLVNGFPDHRKYGESLFRLGQVHLRLDDEASARQYLQQAIDSGSAIASQAEQLLSDLDQAGN